MLVGAAGVDRLLKRELPYWNYWFFAGRLGEYRTLDIERYSSHNEAQGVKDYNTAYDIMSGRQFTV
jgi:hypothetical protein